jgi:chromosome segregation ATPase
MTNITLLGQQVQQLQRYVSTLSASITDIDKKTNMQVKLTNTPDISSLEQQLSTVVERVQKLETMMNSLTQSIDEKIKDGLKGVLETIDSLLNVAPSESLDADSPVPQASDDIVISTKKTITKKSK